jgi:ATP-dependent helicase/nuclease subunit A
MAKQAHRPGGEKSATGGKLPPDQSVRDLITCDLRKNILVEASAGTGKTTSLVARMINLIRQGECPVGKLAAVTFTRKAAAELRSRFQVGLEQAARAAAGIERQRLAQAVAHVERAFLGTIHSFCARLIRERPVEAGVDSEFTEIDEPQDSELRRQAWLEHVARLIASDDPLLAELEELGLEIGQLASAFERFALYPDVANWPAEEIAVPDPEPVQRALAGYIAHLESLAPSLPADPGQDKLIPTYRRLPRFVRQSNLRCTADLYATLETFDRSEPKVVQRNWPGGKPQAVAEAAAWTAFARDHAIPYVETLRHVRYSRILRVLRPAVAIYDRLRRDAGVLNYQDLLLTAARMLRESAAVRKYFRGRFTHLLIDEFQDTDPIQAEVMLLLTADDPNEPDWRRCRPVNGSLFVVGDPKQSIYRFRRADIVTYGKVKEIIERHGGRVVALTANFRTTASLVGWINGAFEKRFPGVASEAAPAFSPLQVGRFDERAGDLTGLHALEAAGTNKDEILGHETAVVARTIRQALDAPRTVGRSQREGDIPSPAQPGDFLIITRNTTNLSRYASELQALSIPHQVTGGTTLNELDELSLLCSCLRVLVRPDDPVSLVAALRSELFGISDAALYEFKRAGGQFSFRRPVPAAGISRENGEAIKDTFERLGRYYKWLYLLPPAAALEKIAADLGLLARAAAAPGGDVRAGSLAKLFALVRGAQREQRSLTDLLDYLDNLAASEPKHDGIPLRPHSGSVVRVMNLHKVKGLEAPVVFLADPTGQSDHPVGLHIDRSGEDVRGYMAVYEPKRNQGFFTLRLLACPVDWERWKETERAFLEAENQRLLYVAATRAGTCLVITQRGTRAGQNPWKSLADELPDHDTLQDPGPQAAPARQRIAVGTEEAKTEHQEINKRWGAVRQPTYETEAIKEISLRRSPPWSDSDRGTPPAPDLHPDARPAEDSLAGEHGVEWGEDMHALLEAAMRGPDSNLESLARSLTREREGDEERVTALLLTVGRVRQSAIWQRARASRRFLAEVSLMTMVPENQAGIERPTVRRGVIDLAFLEAEGWVIVDYKTDQVEPRSIPKLVEHYRPQVQSYSAAWETLVGQPVHEVGLFFTYANRYERLDRLRP